MAYGYVNGATTANTTNPTGGVAITLSYTPAASTNLLVIYYLYFHNAAPTVSISDTATNTWNSLASVDNVASFGGVRAWWAQSVGSSATTISVSASTVTTTPNFGIVEYNGLLTTSAVFVSGEVATHDQSTVDQGNTANAITAGPTATPTTNPVLCLGMTFDTNVADTVVAGTGFTNRQALKIGTSVQGLFEDKRITSNSAGTVTFTGGNASGVFPITVAALFHEPPVGGGPVSPIMYQTRYKPYYSN